MRQKEEIQTDMVTTSEKLGLLFKELGEHYINRGAWVIDSAPRSFDPTDPKLVREIEELNLRTEEIGMQISMVSRKIALLAKELAIVEGKNLHACDTCGHQHS